MTDTSIDLSGGRLNYVDFIGNVISFSTDPREARLEEKLIEREEWDELARFRRRQLRECPCKECAIGLADALLTAEKAAEALEVLRRWEAENPGDPQLVEVILDALQELGRELDYFPWSRTPRIHRLDDHTLDLCLLFLEQRGEPLRISKLRSIVFADSYLDFDADTLAEALVRDPRFVVRTAKGTTVSGKATVDLRRRVS